MITNAYNCEEKTELLKNEKKQTKNGEKGKNQNTCLARFPNTNSIASITLLLPLPLGPTTAEKL